MESFSNTPPLPLLLSSLHVPTWCFWIPFACLSLCRVSEQEAALEETHRLLQQFPLDLEKFLSWITEAETTANVLQDASRKEKLLEDSRGVRELMKPWQVSWVFQLWLASESHWSSLSICTWYWQTGDKNKVVSLSLI
jgi:hypothetical protein